MKDLILIPTFARPEYLSLCLEHVAAADKVGDHEVWVSHDRHVNDVGFPLGQMEISKQVVAKAGARMILRQPHPYIGNPCNFLELYKEAFSQPDVRYVFLIEDDVLIAKDFFRWHAAVQERGDYFCSVGWHCVRYDKAIRDDDPTSYIESAMDFSSIGVCWKREKLAPFVQHATPKFYCAMRDYLARAFPNNPIPAGQWTEQAGVVTRLLHAAPGQRVVAWPTRRRCSHVGVSGYHRPNGFRFSGELPDRVKALRAAVMGEAILGMSKDFVDDIEPLLSEKEWDPSQLHCVQRLGYTRDRI